MAGHFLLKPIVRNLTIRYVASLGEDECRDLFRRIRWQTTKGIPVCPKCGCVGAWELTRNRFKCKAKECRAEFTITSGTVLAWRKLSFQTIMMAIALFAQDVKGHAALKLVRETGIAYKSAWTLYHKLREAIGAEREHVRLDGEVEVDATFLGGYIRPKNKKADREDRRVAEVRNGKRQCIMAFRQRKGRIVATVVPGEDADSAWAMARQCVAPEAIIIADEAKAYDDLHGRNAMVRNNHGEAYVVEPRASTNQAESFFARFKRSVKGIYHRMSGTYLDLYVAELAFREYKARTTPEEVATEIIFRALNHPVSRNVKGYWQGIRPPGVLAMRFSREMMTQRA